MKLKCKYDGTFTRDELIALFGLDESNVVKNELRIGGNVARLNILLFDLIKDIEALNKKVDTLSKVRVDYKPVYNKNKVNKINKISLISNKKLTLRDVVLSDPRTFTTRSPYRLARKLSDKYGMKTSSLKTMISMVRREFNKS